MRNQGQFVFGAVVIFIGLMLLISNIFNIDLWAFCWPTLLILLGLWVLLRPQISRSGTGLTLVPIGDIRRNQSWPVEDEEFLVFVSDVDLDLREADIPDGTTRYRLYGFVGDVELQVPPEVGVSLSATSFVSDIKAFGDRQENFLFPLQLTSDNYQTAQKRVDLTVTAFISDIKLKQL